MSSSDDRQKRLDRFNETFSRDLDTTVKQDKMQFRQSLSRDFDNAMKDAEEYAKRGDHLNAFLSKQRAEMLDNMLKDME